MKVNWLMMYFSMIVAAVILVYFVYRPHMIETARLDQTMRNIKDDPDSPLANLRRNGYTKKLPSLTELQKADTTVLWTTFHSYLDNTDIICNRKIRMGHIADGGWEICDDRNVRPVKPCIVYSFGINRDFSFDDDVTRLYGCSVHSFDPSMIMQSVKRAPNSWFHRIGIGGKDGKQGSWQLMTLSSIRKMLNHSNNIIDVLKIDTELAEWPSLENMIKVGDLRSVRQLLIEFHGNWKIKQDTREEALEHLTTIKGIEDAGFRRFYITKNKSCKIRTKYYPVIRTRCYEMHYVNTNILP